MLSVWLMLFFFLVATLEQLAYAMHWTPFLVGGNEAQQAYVLFSACASSPKMKARTRASTRKCKNRRAIELLPLNPGAGVSVGREGQLREPRPRLARLLDAARQAALQSRSVRSAGKFSR